MQTPSPIILRSPSPNLDSVTFDKAVLQDKDDYLKKLKKWQKRILEVQQAYYHQNRRAIIVFEGWDASGKGGAIRRITEKLDPRGFTVHPISAPTCDRTKQTLPATFPRKIATRRLYRNF